MQHCSTGRLLWCQPVAIDLAYLYLTKAANTVADAGDIASQEKAEASRVSAEAAELHSLLQTGKLERQTQVQNLNELQAENSALAQRVAELDAKNDENERVLASVLSRSQSNGHHQWQHPNRLEGGVWLRRSFAE